MWTYSAQVDEGGGGATGLTASKGRPGGSIDFSGTLALREFPSWQSVSAPPNFTQPAGVFPWLYRRRPTPSCKVTCQICFLCNVKTRGNSYRWEVGKSCTMYDKGKEREIKCPLPQDPALHLATKARDAVEHLAPLLLVDALLLDDGGLEIIE